MNFSSIQINLRGIIIFQLIFQLNNVVALFIFILIFYYLDIMLIITIIYIYTIDNFIHFNLYHVDMCHYLS